MRCFRQTNSESLFKRRKSSHPDITLSVILFFHFTQHITIPMRTHPSLLNPRWREQVLRDLIRRFLPAIDSRHRNTSNEIQYVSTTLSRICLQHIGFRLTTQEVIDALQATGHQFFTRDGLCYPDGSPIRNFPNHNLFGETIETNTPANDRLQNRIHTNVPHQTVRIMRLTTIPTPSGTADEKCQQTSEMLERLKKWGAKWEAAVEELPYPLTYP